MSKQISSQAGKDRGQRSEVGGQRGWEAGRLGGKGEKIEVRGRRSEVSEGSMGHGAWSRERRAKSFL